MVSMASVGMGFTIPLVAQDDHHFHHNDIAVFAGGITPLNEDAGGKTALALGADYERRFTTVVGAQALGELSFGDHKRTALAVLNLTVRPVAPLRLAAGPRIEWVEQDPPPGSSSGITQAGRRL